MLLCTKLIIEKNVWEKKSVVDNPGKRVNFFNECQCNAMVFGTQLANVSRLLGLPYVRNFSNQFVLIVYGDPMIEKH